MAELKDDAGLLIFFSSVDNTSCRSAGRQANTSLLLVLYRTECWRLNTTKKAHFFSLPLSMLRCAHTGAKRGAARRSASAIARTDVRAAAFERLSALWSRS